MTTIAIRVAAIAAIGAAGLAASACDDPTGAAASEFSPALAELAWAALEPASPRQQQGSAGELAPSNPTVRVLSLEGTPVAGVAVRFAVIEGNGTVSAARVTSDANGLASVSWRLGPAPGTNRVRASARGVERVIFTATASAPVADVEVSPGSLWMDALGAAIRLTGYAFDAAGGTLVEPLTWHTLEPAVATVDSAGLVRSVSNGSARVVAASRNGTADTVEIVVAQRVAAVRVTPAVDTLLVGTTARLDATATDANGYPVASATFLWTSASPTIASVTATGEVAGVAAGTTTISATADGRADSSLVVVQASAPPPPSGRRILFHSDWATARGSSSSAVLDLAKPRPWDAATSAFGAGSEIVAAPAGFPTANALVTRASDGAEDVSFEAVSGYFAPPAVGEAIYYRLYVRVDVPDWVSGDLSWHPWQDTYGAGNWVGDLVTAQNGTWSWRIQTTPEVSAPWPYYRWGENTRLNIGEVYRLEWAFERTGLNTFQLHMRVYDATGTLLYDDDDIQHIRRTGETLAQWNAAGNQLRFANLAALPGLTVGVNGFSGNGGDWVFSYTAGVAICTGGWCGPYVLGEGTR